MREILGSVLTLNPNFYQNADISPKALKVAQVVVIVAAIAHAIGSIIFLLIAQVRFPILLLIFAVNILVVVAGYYVWTWTIYQLGKRLKLPIPSYQELLIPVGFAHIPQIFNFLTVIPLLGRPIEIGLSTWSLLAVIVGIKGKLNIKPRQATVICLIGWLIVEIIIGVVQVIIQWLI